MEKILPQYNRLSKIVFLYLLIIFLYLIICFFTAPLSAKIDPDSQTVDVGKMATLSCRVMGHPVHSVVWLKNGIPLVTAGSVNLVSRDILQINPVKREDSGVYQCMVSNDEESVQGAADLFVAGMFI